MSRWRTPPTRTAWANGERAAWTSQVDFDIPILGEDVDSAEYLYWVGCAGSFDDRNQKVTVATARLLHEAGVEFAILGPAELCTGDPARRSGNEFVFQHWRSRTSKRSTIWV